MLVALVLVCSAIAVGTPACTWPNGTGVAAVYRAGSVPAIKYGLPNVMECHQLGLTYRVNLGLGQMSVVQCVNEDDVK